jgi:predicted porin
MKKNVLLASFMTVLAGTVSAQTSVTLYGVVDVGFL